MRVVGFSALLASAIFLASPTAPTFACNGNGNCANAPGQIKGAPGPLVGAGLPILAAGYGVYWLMRRRRKPD
jgi:hypothetical protein